MAPESIAGFTIPEEQLEDLIEALAEQSEDNVIPIRPDLLQAA